VGAKRPALSPGRSQETGPEITMQSRTCMSKLG